jgi:hypothetical protein
MARVMVADLFLYNRQLSAPGLTEAQIRSALERDYQGARQTFRSRASPRAWQSMDYLEVEFEREIQKRVQSADGPPPAAQSPSAPEQDQPVSDRSQDLPEPAAWDTPAVAAEPAPPVGDAEHVKARRVARVLVADLFLYHSKVIVPANTEQYIRSVLTVELSAARETFELRVPEHVRKERDYFAIEFERRLRDLGVQPAPDAAKPPDASKATEVGAGNDGAAVTEAAKSGQPTADVEEVSEDEQHLRAASVARLLIAELLLDNWQQVETGVRDRNLLALLDDKCKAARQAFESRVPSHIWKETHYFEVQLERLLWELQGGPLDVESERQLNDFVSIVGSSQEKRPS